MEKDLSNKYERRDFEKYCERLLAEGAVVELTKKSPKRSLAQNNYLYLLLGWFSMQTGYKVQEVKELVFKRFDNTDIFVRTQATKFNDEPSTYLRSTAELSTAELATAITRFRNWSSACAGIYLPAANETEHLRYIKNEIERNSEHIEQYNGE